MAIVIVALTALAFFLFRKYRKRKQDPVTLKDRQAEGAYVPERPEMEVHRQSETGELDITRWELNHPGAPRHELFNHPNASRSELPQSDAPWRELPSSHWNR